MDSTIAFAPFVSRLESRTVIADGCDSNCLHAPLRDLSNSRDTTYRQRKKKALHFMRLNDKQAVRFLPIGGDLRQKFVGAGPAEAVRFNSWRICSRIIFATPVAVGSCILFSVASNTQNIVAADTSAPLRKNRSCIGVLCCETQRLSGKPRA